MSCLGELPKCLSSGLDSLYLSVFLDVSTGLLDFDELEYLKRRAATNSDRFAEISLGGETFALKPYGRKPYRYVLGNDVFEIRLAERMHPACFVQFLSKGLWHLGLDGALERFDDWCELLELPRFREDVPSRADWAFDFHLPARDFGPDDFVSNAKKDAQYRENGFIQTFTIGRDQVVMRVYDKIAEIEQQSGKTWFFDLWGTRSDVWRVEAQVRRARLREGGIETIADLKAYQNDLLRELTTRHTTLRIPTGDSNRSRRPLHPLWQSLQNEIQKLPQTGLVQSIASQNELSYRWHILLRSLYGTTKALAAIEALSHADGEISDLDGLISRLPHYLDDLHRPMSWNDEIQKRITAHELGQW